MTVMHRLFPQKLLIITTHDVLEERLIERVRRRLPKFSLSFPSFACRPGLPDRLRLLPADRLQK
jgi:hypothetical protein